ncbi:hypothetical protein ACFO5Q_03820 [Kordiimonas lipolytica]|uniref:Uncharacterized protein n=1 Tax=Kordiimonas lipolytica TaxID=1662421 RepID=A0ABV8U7Y8_9PROT|nr:hypothetical protein [Kordiimonas lipolytica]
MNDWGALGLISLLIGICGYQLFRGFKTGTIEVGSGGVGNRFNRETQPGTFYFMALLWAGLMGVAIYGLWQRIAGLW